MSPGPLRSPRAGIPPSNTQRAHERPAGTVTRTARRASLLWHQALEGVRGQGPGGIPVGAAIAAFAALFQAGQLPTVSTDPVHQLQHRLAAVGEVLAQALARARATRSC